VLPDVTECYIFRIYHLVTRVLISPAPWPLGAPSIGKKETSRQRIKEPVPAHRVTRRTVPFRTAARKRAPGTTLGAPTSRLVLVLWHPPQADQSRIQNPNSKMGGSLLTSATRHQRAHAYPHCPYNNMRCLRRFAGFYHKIKRTVPMIYKVDEVKTIAAQSQYEKSANNG
jgi:hypothetical protein